MPTFLLAALAAFETANAKARDPVWIDRCKREERDLFLCNGGRIHGLQSVTMIGMNFECVPGQTIGGKTGDNMRETQPGTWRGHIEYTMRPRPAQVGRCDGQGG